MEKFHPLFAFVLTASSVENSRRKTLYQR